MKEPEKTKTGELVLYKYQSVEPFDYLLDVLQNKEFYCPTFDKLNDPMEGVLDVEMSPPPRQLSGMEGLEYLRKKGERMDEHLQKFKKWRICSFSSVIDVPLMWAHYAGGFSGICFKCEVPASDIHSIKHDFIPEDRDSKTFLCKKLKCWAYENEWRYIGPEKQKFLSVRIKKVYIGPNYRRWPKSFLNCILKYIDNNEWSSSLIKLDPSGEVHSWDGDF